MRKHRTKTLKLLGLVLAVITAVLLFYEFPALTPQMAVRQQEASYLISDTEILLRHLNAVNHDGSYPTAFVTADDNYLYHTEVKGRRLFFWWDLGVWQSTRAMTCNARGEQVSLIPGRVSNHYYPGPVSGYELLYALPVYLIDEGLGFETASGTLAITCDGYTYTFKGEYEPLEGGGVLWFGGHDYTMQAAEGSEAFDSEWHDEHIESLLSFYRFSEDVQAGRWELTLHFGDYSETHKLS